MLDQLLLVVKGVLKAEEDATHDPDDDHHADDDERGRHNQQQQSHIIISKKRTWNPLGPLQQCKKTALLEEDVFPEHNFLETL